MELFNAQNLSYHNGTKSILNNANFRILQGDKIGLIGPNGVGKTTLIRMLLGELEADSGKLHRIPHLNVGFLPQKPQFDKDQSIEDFLLANQAPLQLQLKDCETAMESASEQTMENLLLQYQQLLDKFEQQGGYEAQERGENLLRRLGLDNPMEQSVQSLSGGEQSLLCFARALLGNPDLLILDEPGNHLDYLGLAWLESFIAGFPQAILVVSHNRYLLDKSCSELWDMEAHNFSVFQGRYSDYRTQKYRRLITQQSEYDYCQKEKYRLTQKIKQLQSIAMSQYNPPPRVMAELGAAKKVLGQIEDRMPEKPPVLDQSLNLDFGEDSSRSKVALRVEDFSWNFGERQLFKSVKMEIFCGEKVALVGPNGCGKSTLIQALLNQGEWDHPRLKIGPSQKIGYLSQKPQYSPLAETLMQEIRSWGPISMDEATTLALKLNFPYEDLNKPLKVLSGGEGNRLQLGRLIYQETNFLILDEPTNHMDIPARESIEAAIKEFPGTLLVVSHDRFFLDQLVDRVVEIDQLKLNSHEGNFSQFFQNRYPVLPRLGGSVSQRAKEKHRADHVHNDSLKLLEQRITNAEEEKLKLQKELEKAYQEKDSLRGKQLAKKLDKLISRLDHLYEQWERAV
ncbi:MAG: ABC-F family ATP-binding cassette domain-containing protein [Spirochaetaceae bacterium]|nr:ABC-F family ATP-binding cassette domain-containing protein [Spirochaetaceae bacterium]